MSDEFTAAVDLYLEQQQLSQDYALEALQLRKIAESLDKRMTVGMVQQFGLALRNLKKQLGQSAGGHDELDDMLEGFGI